MLFYLGTHEVSWLRRTDVPLFISRRRLYKRKSYPIALGPWCLDSGGFSELTLYDRWVTTAPEYVEEVYRYQEQIGKLVWASPQDWMCEPHMIVKTGLSIEEHQARTVENYLTLKQMAPGLPFIPVLQGWEIGDYWACIERYENHGVDLLSEPVVGLGSVCRRQHTSEIADIVEDMHGYGLKLHGFGVKVGGLEQYGPQLLSADSMAWSFNARYAPPLPSCTGHKNCANCIDYALLWRSELLRRTNQLPEHSPQ